MIVTTSQQTYVRFLSDLSVKYNIDKDIKEISVKDNFCTFGKLFRQINEWKKEKLFIIDYIHSYK